MRSDPAADVHADRREFFPGTGLASPDAGLSRFAPGDNAELRRRTNHGLFEHSHIPHNVTPDLIEVQDRVAHNLPRPVIGDVAAARSLKVLNALLPKDIFAGKQVCALSAASKRNDMRMLTEEHHVPDGPGFSRCHHAFLKLQRFGIADQPEVNLQRFRHRSLTAH
jgi:hypothetical protein